MTLSADSSAMVRLLRLVERRVLFILPCKVLRVIKVTALHSSIYISSFDHTSIYHSSYIDPRDCASIHSSIVHPLIH